MPESMVRMGVVIPPGAVRTTSWIADYLVAGPPAATDIGGFSTPLDSVLTAEMTAAQLEMAVLPAEMILAALGRSIARTLGYGRLDVDVETDILMARLSGRTALPCRDLPEESGRPMVMVARRALKAAAPDRGREYPADLRFTYRTQFPGPAPDSGHLLALHASQHGTAVHLHWWYDTRSFERNTVEELAAQLPLALIAICAGP